MPVSFMRRRSILVWQWPLINRDRYTFTPTVQPTSDLGIRMFFGNNISNAYDLLRNIKIQTYTFTAIFVPV
jgi:hypothetical protein